jgi:hypothetical protein
MVGEGARCRRCFATCLRFDWIGAVDFWCLFAKLKVLQACILKNNSTDSKKPGEGKWLFNRDTKPSACRLCHGARGIDIPAHKSTLIL